MARFFIGHTMRSNAIGEMLQLSMFAPVSQPISIFKKISVFFTRLFYKTPNAAQAWQQAGGKAQHAFWLFATPVHLALGRDHFVLTDPAQIQLQDDEADALITTLNAHFSYPEFYLKGFTICRAESVWFLGIDTDPKISTTPLALVINKDISSFLPTGEGAMTWMKWQNELQMLLFNHPVNQGREARGEPPISSLWCHGLAQSMQKE